jgi:AcrR family transcriptional regulator
VTDWSTGTPGALASAAKRLAAAHSIDQVSVTELCREAGLTRDTFYRYAASPIEVLAQALDEELGELPLGGAPDRSVMDAPTRVLLEHVRDHQTIYRNALHPHLDAALRDVLVARITALLVAYADTHPHAVPLVAGRAAGPAERRVFAAYAASGAVGAVEQLLGEGELVDLERAGELLHTASAPWWLAPPEGPERGHRE